VADGGQIIFRRGGDFVIVNIVAVADGKFDAWKISKDSNQRLAAELVDDALEVDGIRIQVTYKGARNIRFMLPDKAGGIGVAVAPKGGVRTFEDVSGLDYEFSRITREQREAARREFSREIRKVISE